MKLAIEIDPVGRIVLPKLIRQQLGVFGRTALTVEVVGEKAELALANTAPTKLARKNGRSVYAGALPKEWHSGEAVTLMRAARDRTA
jgi:bifunctional DNA-binding transcriptional regulator/antitoxin component of YhaV-PrlF toxin-antitoxin module